MTHKLQNLSDELHRITSYTGLMAQLAQDGNKTKIETMQLQQIFEDIATVTAKAYAELETIINSEAYIDRYDQ